jgi:hypothetical protein
MNAHTAMLRTVGRALAWIGLAAAAIGCETVAFYEKEHLNDPSMLMEENPTETHLLQKTLYSREGSAGGIGSSAGGGCGCY